MLTVIYYIPSSPDGLSHRDYFSWKQKNMEFSPHSSGYNRSTIYSIKTRTKSFDRLPLRQRETQKHIPSSKYLLGLHSCAFRHKLTSVQHKAVKISRSNGAVWDKIYLELSYPQISIFWGAGASRLSTHLQSDELDRNKIILRWLRKCDLKYKRLDGHMQPTFYKSKEVYLPCHDHSCRIKSKVVLNFQSSS